MDAVPVPEPVPEPVETVKVDKREYVAKALALSDAKDHADAMAHAAKGMGKASAILPTEILEGGYAPEQLERFGLLASLSQKMHACSPTSEVESSTTSAVESSSSAGGCVGEPAIHADAPADAPTNAPADSSSAAEQTANHDVAKRWGNELSRIHI